MITIEHIRELGCCYDPSKYLPEGWAGTALDIIEMNNIPTRDRLWVLCREQFIGEYNLRLLEEMSVGFRLNSPNMRACRVAYSSDSYTLIRVLRFMLREG